ncbi:MAG: DUF4402 domain-containing protein [Bacteroidota bacterium]
MKKAIFILGAIIAFTGLTNYSIAQATASANAGVKIVKALTLTKTADLHFGTMTVPSAGVVISLTTGNSRSALPSNNITLLSQAPTSSNSAYTVTGSANSTYTITLPTSDVTIYQTFPTTYTIVNNFIAKTASTGTDGLNGTLDGSGNDSFVVGAKLNLAGAQPFGTYTGTFSVTINYN